MVDVGLGGFRDGRFVPQERKLVRFPNVTEGRLADAIALLEAPGTEGELRSEERFRRMYRSAAQSWPVPVVRRNRLSVMVGVASVASVFATATGLSAASVLPSPAAHVVNAILDPLNGSPTKPPPTATQPGTPVTATGGTAASGTTAAVAAASPVAAANVADTNTRANNVCRHSKGSCSVHHAHSLKAHGTTVGTSGGVNQAVGADSGPTQAGGSTQPTSTSSSAPTPAGAGGSLSGSTPGTGTDRGGNLGGGSGSTSSTGTTGTGTTGTEPPGTGTSRGGNLGTGGGTKGTKGKSRGHHGGHHGNGTRSGLATGGGAGATTGTRHHRGSQNVSAVPPTGLGSTAPNLSSP
jgi:hypothetical protein